MGAALSQLSSGQVGGGSGGLAALLGQNDPTQQSTANPFAQAAQVQPQAMGDNPIQTASLATTAPYRDPQVNAQPHNYKNAPESQVYQGNNRGASGGGDTGQSQADVEAYIREQAKLNGVDPDTAVKVAMSEGLAGFDPGKGKISPGDGNSSFGPFQLHYGGINPKMNNPGMGDDFTKATGLDARDPSTWKQQVQFAMQSASKNGWGAWMGAKNTGIGNWAGIKSPGVGQAGTQMAHQGGTAPGGTGWDSDALRAGAENWQEPQVATNDMSTGAAAPATGSDGTTPKVNRWTGTDMSAPAVAPEAPAAQSQPAVDLGAPQVAQTQSSLTQAAVNGTATQKQRKQALEDKVHNRTRSA